MASSSSSSRELQKELEAKANDLSKIQKGKSSSCFFIIFLFCCNIIMILFTDISKNHQVRKKYTIQLGENELVLKELDLLNEDANVYKLIGPVLVKQDLAEANANVKKRIEYISAELKRLDSTLQDLEEKQNSKKEAVSYFFSVFFFVCLINLL
ncbi:putative prefoldin beta [Helianthus annuus]|nr:putative prefoldin beta [Helianthus annuus]